MEKGRITLDSNDEELKIEMSAEKKMFFQRTKKLGHFVKKITRIYKYYKDHGYIQLGNIKSIFKNMFEFFSV